MNGYLYIYLYRGEENLSSAKMIQLEAARLSSCSAAGHVLPSPYDTIDEIHESRSKISLLLLSFLEGENDCLYGLALSFLSSPLCCVYVGSGFSLLFSILCFLCVYSNREVRGEESLLCNVFDSREAPFLSFSSSFSPAPCPLQSLSLLSPHHHLPEEHPLNIHNRRSGLLTTTQKVIPQIPEFHIQREKPWRDTTQRYHPRDTNHLLSSFEAEETSHHTRYD